MSKIGFLNYMFKLGKAHRSRERNLRITVIGLGFFGRSLCRFLSQRGAEVLAIDRDMKLVNEAAPHATEAVRLDAADIHLLRKFNLEEYDTVVVAMGENFTDSFIITTHLKELGAQHIVARATSATNKIILEKLGADEVILPEEIVGYSVAQRLVDVRVVDAIRLNDRFSVIEIATPEFMTGRRLGELELRERYGVQIVVVRHRLPPERRPRPEDFAPSQRRKTPPQPEEYTFIELPDSTTFFTGDEMLVLVGGNDELGAITDRGI